MNRLHPHSRTTLAALAAGACLAAAFAAHADIYRCVDAVGEVGYRDSPCPAGHAMSANITSDVQACTTEECEAQLERARASAEERLRAERAALSEMQDRRLRAEEAELQRRLHLQQLDHLQTLETQLAAQRAVDSGVYYPGYPLYPGFGQLGYGHAGRPCRGAQCAPRSDRPGMNRPPRVRERSVNVIAPGPNRQPK